MAGYAASGRLRGVVPRFVGTSAPRHPRALSGAAVAATVNLAVDADPIDLVGRPIDQRIGDWLASVGEAWSQATFFLFDPESWR